MAPLSRLHFDIDDHLNPFLPSPPWHVIPYPISYMLGYRKQPPEKYGNILLIIRALLGVFVSLVLIQLVSRYVLGVAPNGPLIVGSFGAAAVLEFYALESPFAQPRNFLVSQLIATVVGVSFCTLFRLHSDADWVRWLGGALACASTTALMGLTNTVHPPAGATALIAVVDDRAVSIGWRLIPLTLLGCTVMLFVALLLNNLFGRFPLYWWTASDLAASPVGPSSGSSSGDEEKARNNPAELVIIQGKVIMPEGIRLSAEERLVLERISNKLL
ncbi:HPP family protein [Xylariaceae sp. FL1651]|nr:HPP family protein [Xylariaceae sp. FL1651]